MENDENANFKRKIESLTLRYLESEIKKLYDSNSDINEKRIKDCLQLRKFLINKDYSFNHETIKQIERINQILTYKTARVLKKAIELDKQMQAIKANGDDFLEDYEIEGRLEVNSNIDNLILLEEDENNGQSDYSAMNEILYNLDNTLPSCRSFYFHDRDNTPSHETEEEIYTDKMLKLNWNIELLGVQELKHIEYFCWASHLLFCDSLYSISDVIRIKDFCMNVKVEWKNLGEK